MQAPPRFNSAGPCEVRVEILTANHERIPGFTADDADALTATGTAQACQLERKSPGRPASGAGGPAAVPLQERQALLVPVPVAEAPAHPRQGHAPRQNAYERDSRRLIP